MQTVPTKKHDPLVDLVIGAIFGGIVVVVLFYGSGTGFNHVRTETVEIGTVTVTSVTTYPFVAPYYYHPTFQVINGLNNQVVPKAYITLQGQNGAYVSGQPLSYLITNSSGLADSRVNILAGTVYATVWAANYTSITTQITVSNGVTTFYLYPLGCFVGQQKC